ncbi:hypothetical protein NYE69_33425 [Paenibacillus sp. FSL R5-0527]|uniref:hypothetical protein n=1 Tax=Paenibacillus sp. FSL R5-0527 TaxID=2975321 RepID=UPI00097A5D09|nr:hypothetical protein BK140_33285 [Paenibacillus macerans]
MSVYVVSYNLNKAGQDYNGLYEVLKSFGYCKYLDSTWLIATNLTADQLWQRIQPHVDKNDRVLIIRVTNEYSGWLPKPAWEWIKEHVG